MSDSRIRVLSVFGTRPEAIKMAPVIRELTCHPERISSRVCVTGQHREMLDQVLDLFDIVPDHDLDLMEDDQSPTQVASAVMAQLEPILQAEQPDWVLVQGDTTTVAAAAWAAFYAHVKVGHVEAGLRTHDKWQPFPEEVNRKVAGAIADLHFAPTDTAQQNLLREGVGDDDIVVTGNPVIDALQWVAERPFDARSFQGFNVPTFEPSNAKTILVTAHRRENHGEPLANICSALRDVAERYGDHVLIVYPLHLNPNV